MQKINKLISLANETEPENEGLEEESKKAFITYWNTCNEIADEIVLLTDGKIGKMAASKLAFGQREDVLKMLD